MSKGDRNVLVTTEKNQGGRQERESRVVSLGSVMKEVQTVKILETCISSFLLL
jgi:hypothetical protein